MMKRLGRLWPIGYSRLWLLLVLLAGCTPKVDTRNFNPELVLENGWHFRQVNKSEWFDAKVPGTVHTDLKNAGLIGEPFYGNNEQNLQWIERENWEYRCRFLVDSQLLQQDFVELIFEGLDTYATVFLNGIQVLQCNNMFIPWQVEVKSFLKSGENELLIVFESPVTKHKEEAGRLGYNLPCDNDSTHTSPFVRKAAYHFGWDWAPRFVTSGIWKPVRLRSWSKAIIEDVFVEQVALSPDSANLRAHFSIKSSKNQELSIRLAGVNHHFKTEPGLNKISFDFKIEKPVLWQPNGVGESYLYYFQAMLSDSEYLLSEKEVVIGLRNIRLVNEADSIGTSFYFEVNGQPLFAKGANYIPQDVFLPRVKPQQYRELLMATRDAGMNMLRVWGGGIYEQDLFYQLCDSLGIMIWQDFMFAGTAYPGDSAFVENVKREITYQTKRLRKHPSLVLFCGNNEIDVAWHNWGWQQKYGYTPEDSATIWNDQLSLFHSILPEIVQRECPNLQYVPTSPQSNWGKSENFNHGSMHYWGVWHGREPIENFKTNVGRFMVEYGMQSYPSWQTLQEYIKQDDLTLESPVVLNRQKSYIGNVEIERHIKDLGLEYIDLKSYVEQSHRIQAEALRVAVVSHLNSNGHCMGTLFWQLNDCWPGPSWSVIDYRGRKKPGFQEITNIFNQN